jgi:membrane protein implicated in regulation of membrane protease activity
MSDQVRLQATTVIWLALAAILIFAGPQLGGVIVPLTFILAIAAAVSTGAIWESANSTDTKVKEKRKRANRLKRLADKLDDADLDELANLVAARHAEDYGESRR